MRMLTPVLLLCVALPATAYATDSRARNLGVVYARAVLAFDRAVDGALDATAGSPSLSGLMLSRLRLDLALHLRRLQAVQQETGLRLGPLRKLLTAEQKRIQRLWRLRRSPSTDRARRYRSSVRRCSILRAAARRSLLPYPAQPATCAGRATRHRRRWRQVGHPGTVVIIR